MPKFEQTSSDKYKLVGLGNLPAPGACFTCGNGTCEFGYVDLGTWIEYVGEALICYTCVEQISEIIGCLLPDEAKHLQIAAEAAADENVTLNRELDAANERLINYDSMFRDAFFGVAGTGSVPSMEDGPDLFQAASGSEDGESETEESVDSGGSERVSDASADQLGRPPAAPGISI